MKRVVIILLYVSGIIQTQALIINEIMSNPVGDDSGREWIEVYNNTNAAIDISSLTISIKGGNPIVVTPISGGTSVPPNGYAIIGSTVSGATRFLQDYPNYSGVLFKSSISLVNTGVTSLLIKIGGETFDNLASYTGAKEGSTLSLVLGNFVTGNPTPGGENQAVSSGTENVSGGTQENATTTENQTTVAQMSPPSADIVLYLKPEKVVVAGAESLFSVFGMTRKGDPISNLSYTWAFGDGGQGMGSSTLYRYLYPGMYTAQVEATNGQVIGTGRMRVRVVPPDISITKLGDGKYGPYIDISNPNMYDLDLSHWKLSIDGKLFDFPKNTLISHGETTHFSGSAMGFSSTTLSSSTVVKILFPNHEEVTRYGGGGILFSIVTPTQIAGSRTQNRSYKETIPKVPVVVVKNTSTSSITKVAYKKDVPKDTRIATFFKSLFKNRQ